MRLVLRDVMGETDYNELRDLMHELKNTLQSHIEQEKEFRPKVEELVTILERSKGVVTFLKVITYIGAPVILFFGWVKDHVKL